MGRLIYTNPSLLNVIEDTEVEYLKAQAEYADAKLRRNRIKESLEELRKEEKLRIEEGKL